MSEKGGKGDREGSRLITEASLMGYRCGQLWALLMGYCCAGNPVRGVCGTPKNCSPRGQQAGTCPTSASPSWVEGCSLPLSLTSISSMSRLSRCWPGRFPRRCVASGRKTQMLGGRNCPVQWQDLSGCRGMWEASQRPLHRDIKGQSKGDSPCSCL